MPGLNASEVRVGISGAVFVAPLGTTLPTDPTAALNAAFVNLGYFTEDGVDVDPSTTAKMIRAWQSRYPVRNLVTERAFRIKFKCEQRNRDVFKLAYGGGTFTVTGTAPNQITKFVPPTAADVYEFALVFEVYDGTITDRYTTARAMVGEVEAIPFKKDEPETYGFAVEVLESSAGVAPWQMYTNDQALAS